MTLNGVKICREVYEILGSSLIFLPKGLIWNKITFQLSISLKLAELVVNRLIKIPSKKFTNIRFSIRFFNAHCKDFKSF